MDLLFVLYGSQLLTGCRWSNNGRILGENLHITNITWIVKSFNPVVVQPGDFMSLKKMTFGLLAFWTEDTVWMLHTYKTKLVYMLISLLWWNIVCQMLTEVTEVFPSSWCFSLFTKTSKLIFFPCFNRWSLWVKKKWHLQVSWSSVSHMLYTKKWWS